MLAIRGRRRREERLPDEGLHSQAEGQAQELGRRSKMGRRPKAMRTTILLMNAGQASEERRSQCGSFFLRSQGLSSVVE